MSPMSTAAAMTVLIAVLALVLLGFFAFSWFKDRDRSREEAHDTERLDGS
jgi:hypothetical protein